MDKGESYGSLYLTVVSEKERVPLVLESVEQFARHQGLGDSYGLLLVVRELLLNAIVHGNKSIHSKLALLRIACRDGLYQVEVEDEGDGFDYNSLELGLPEDPHSLAKRGLVLVNELSEELAFERGGSRIRAIVNPEGRDLTLDQSNFSYLGKTDNREETCTSPMEKSL